MVSTPELRDAATVSNPDAHNFVTIFDPISPVPPITMIFTIPSFGWSSGHPDNRENGEVSVFPGRGIFGFYPRPL
jgi:hypothetical protein